MARILIIEDDFSLARMVEDWLKFEHHLVSIAGTGSEAFDCLKDSSFDLLILDWELPDMEGPEICKRFRAKSASTPVLMLTARKSLADKVGGFDAGVDDFLTKPFHMKELSVRVRALLRRPLGLEPLEAVKLSVGNIVLDPESYRVWKGGIEVELQRKEFQLLEFFLRHPNQVFSAESLLVHVWDPNTEASPDTVRTCLKKLRRKIEEDDQSQLIKNVHGVGYRLDA